MGGMKLLFEWPHLVEASLCAAGGETLVCSGPCTVRFWSLRDGEPLTPPLESPPCLTRHLFFAAPDRVLAVGVGCVEWSPRAGTCRLLVPADGDVSYVATPDGRTLAGALLDKHMTHDLRVLRDGKVILERRGDFELHSLALDPKGRWLVLGGSRRWERWDLSSLRKVDSGETREGNFAATFSPDGQTLALVCKKFLEGELTLYSTDRWAAIGPVPVNETAQQQSWSPDSRWLALYSGSAGDDSRSRTVTLWDRQGKRVFFHHHASGVHRAAFSPDSGHLALQSFTGGSTGIIEVPTAKPVAGVACAGNGVSLCFGLPGQLVTGGYDGMEEGHNRARVRVWEYS